MIFVYLLSKITKIRFIVGIQRGIDNCPKVPNSDQLDTDGDGMLVQIDLKNRLL